MSVTQMVEIPADHRLIIDVPSEVPAGTAIITFTPKIPEPIIPSGEPWINPLWGRAKARGSKLTLERLREIQREDVELETELEKRLWKDQR